MRAEKVPESKPATCPSCGHLCEEGEHRCEKCGRRLDDPRRSTAAVHPRESGTGNLRVLDAGTAPPQSRGGSPRILVHGQTDARQRSPAFPDPLRRQLSAQVREFRTRRRPALPFPGSEKVHQIEKVIPIAGPAAHPSQRRETSATIRRPRRSHPTPKLQAPLDFPGLSSEGLAQESPVVRSEPSIAPVAPIRLRAIGHALDFALILAAWLVFLAPLKLLVGEVVFNRFLLAGGLGAGVVLALLYGMIFLYLSGATPAMRYVGLRVVNFDGQPASRPERLWRLLGAVASAGSFLLGFVWAAVDDERFSWHDRISKTFLTPTNR